MGQLLQQGFILRFTVISINSPACNHQPSLVAAPVDDVVKLLIENIVSAYYQYLYIAKVLEEHISLRIGEQRYSQFFLKKNMFSNTVCRHRK